MSIESASALKTLGINILGKFLANKDANSKYISLFMLQKVLKHDIQSVQKYKTTIIDCLKENDSSIKTLALDLLYMIANESNVKQIVKELLNQLLNLNEESEFIQELTNKICAIVDRHAPSRRWYVDTMIKVLILSGNFVSEDSTSSLIHLIAGTPELQSYAVHKLFFSLQENLGQEGLARATIYCLGDFGHLLVQGNATAIV
jgi:AP-1 complex subunit gamma-1